MYWNLIIYFNESINIYIYLFLSKPRFLDDWILCFDWI